MINTYNLFAVPLTHSKFPVPVNLHQKIISYVEKNYTEDQVASCVQGFQFHGDFDGKKELVDTLNKYLNNILKLNIEHSWLNVLSNNSYNQPHVHNGDDVTHSGVFYLSHENNNIHFTKDSNVFEMKPKIFDFIIFPYNLAHYVLPEKRREKRICFAFNLAHTRKGT